MKQRKEKNLPVSDEIGGPIVGFIESLEESPNGDVFATMRITDKEVAERIAGGSQISLPLGVIGRIQ